MNRARFAGCMVCIALGLLAIPRSASAQWGDRALVYAEGFPEHLPDPEFTYLTAAFEAGGAAGVDVWHTDMPSNPDFSEFRVIVYFWPGNLWPTQQYVNEQLRDFHRDGGVIIAACGQADTIDEMNNLALRLGRSTKQVFNSQLSPTATSADPSSHALLAGVGELWMQPLGTIIDHEGTALVVEDDAFGANHRIVVEDRVVWFTNGLALSDNLAPGDSDNAVLFENIWRFYAASKIDNGDFESGHADGWTIVDLVDPTNDTFYVWDGTDTPNTGFGDGFTPGPHDGTWFALSDPAGAATSALIETFSLPLTTTSARLDFDMFVYDASGAAVVDGAGLNHLESDENHHARVDILTDDAATFSTLDASSPGVLVNLYEGEDGNGDMPPYTSHSYELMPDVEPGGVHQVRFAFTTTGPTVNIGVDNVEITICGDGIVDDGEECDVGLNGVFGTCCDASCQYAGLETECRVAEHDCDMPEYCTGDSVACETSTELQPPGTPCGDFYDGQCHDPDTCDAAGICQPNHETDGVDCDMPRLLTFEGLADGENAVNYYNGGGGGDLGVQVPGLARVDADDGGSGDFGGEPSPSTALELTVGARRIVVADGFEDGLFFHYTAPIVIEGEPVDPGEGDFMQVELYRHAFGPDSGTPFAVYEVYNTALGPIEGEAGTSAPFEGFGVTFDGVVEAITIRVWGDEPPFYVVGPIYLDNLVLGGSGPVAGSGEGTCVAGGSCEAGVCEIGLAGPETICRGAGDADCDFAEHCTGDSTDCPPDVVDSGSVCREAGDGGCDVAEVCDGVNPDCPDDDYLPADAECRESFGLCDIAEVCSGSSPDCPDDDFEPDTSVCRVATAGGCDVAEYCPGDAADCPADGYQDSGFECRAATDGGCDLAEACTGDSPDCPPDGYQDSGFECRAATDGGCDLAEACTGDSPDCPPDGYQDSGFECRAATDGGCDLAEACTGGSPDCPADGYQDSGFECRAATDGGCDLAEACTGGSADCPADAFQDSGFECRAATDGGCDLAEACTGGSADCPADGFQDSGFECRAANDGGCDLAEACTGGSPDCPDDGYQPDTFECRPADGDCDLAELCPGSSADCPSDAFDTGTECRASAGACDVAELCTGDGADCPTDAFDTGTECRAADGDCDVAEACDGTDASCPADGFEASGTACGNASDSDCDGADTCDGSGACLTNVADDGSSCADNGAYCDGNESCQTGACVSAGDPCDEAGTACDETTDACVTACGNGALDPGEACDDGNTDDLDGCSALCGIEDGFECGSVGSGTPSVCEWECGDGLFAEGAESCDDGNTDSGDGCDEFCGIEDGFECEVDEETGADECYTLCPDGEVVGDEQCDDGNLDEADGCYDCLIEDGWTCRGEPSVCALTVTCGDGTIGAGEECDDGDTDALDGCSPECTVEEGFECDGAGVSACYQVICGDGLVDGIEECDDRNNIVGDGCAPDCTVEPGYTCDDVEPSDCVIDLSEDPEPEVDNRARGACASTGAAPPASWALWLGFLAVTRRRRRT